MRNFAKLISGLSFESCGFITKSFRDEDFNFQDEPIKPRQEESNLLPLSPAQEYIWIHNHLQPNNASDYISVGFELKGPLNVKALEMSLKEIIRRHEILRTTFTQIDEEIAQVINPTLTLKLVEEDLQTIHEKELKPAIQRQALHEGHNLLDLTKGPLINAKLFRIKDKKYILLITVHRIVADHWSLGIMYRELAVLYKAFSAGKPSPLTELPIQYGDYTLWQRQRMQDNVLESQLEYWKKQFGDELPIMQLLTDKSQRSIRTCQDARHTLTLSKTLKESLKVLSHESGVPLFITLLAAFKTLLYRYTDQEDVIVGLPVDGRYQENTEGLIGCFINTLVIQTNISSTLSFQKLLELVCTRISEAASYQALPLEVLVRELTPERNQRHLPLTQVGFVIQNSVNDRFELPGLIVKPLLNYETHSDFDLALRVLERDDQIQLEFIYNSDIFEQLRVVEIVDQYEHLLSQIVEHPANPVQSYSLVTPKSSQILPNPSMPLPEPRYEPITKIFTSWMESTNVTSFQPAVLQAGKTWSYTELAASAGAIAQMLLMNKMQPGTVVAVSGKQSFGLISCMIGVLLSGGVLLTLDPNLPSRRQKVMLQEGKVKYLLYIGSQQYTDEWVRESIAAIYVEPASGRIVDLDKNMSLPFDTKQMPEVKPEDPAYLFFTSGSTGVPKGVVGCHKGLSHFLNWQRQTFALGLSDHSAQLTGLSFDVVLRDIFTPLISGATLCLPEEEDKLDPARLLHWLEREKITILHTVPSLAQLWLANRPEDVSLKTVRWIFFAGEPLSETLVRRWRNAFPESGDIVNLYGPTETTLAKCFFHVPAEPLPGVQPVGSPIPYTQALIFTPDGHLCGIGEPGEIVIRTPFRSLGYLNANEENQKRFVPNPYSDDERDLLYYTGDRGRYRLDGSLDILGRLDNQVKLRGVRIELGEIETILGEHPTIWQSVVLVREDVPGDKRLVAYFTIKQKKSLSINELRSYLKQKLPDIMVPSSFILLDTMPLTPNGKVDFRALPTLENQRQELEASYIAPRTEVERTIANIWQSVLHVNKVGIHDNFFELGGHSLLATQLISRLREAFQVELPVRSLFKTPTVAELAVTITERKAEQIDNETLVQILTELEQLSPEDIEALLADEDLTKEK